MAGLNVRGFSWPFTFGPRGHANRVEGVSRIKQNLIGIVMTRAGERIRERDFGAFGFELVGRNMTESRLAAVAGFSQDSMSNWEPRATIHTVTATQHDRIDGNAVIIKVPFEVKQLDGVEDVAEAKIGE